MRSRKSLHSMRQEEAGSVAATFDRKYYLTSLFLLSLVVLCTFLGFLFGNRASFDQKCEKNGSYILDYYPLVDGQNGLPASIVKFMQTKGEWMDLNISRGPPLKCGGTHPPCTDIARLKKGKVSAQFWTISTPCGDDDAAAVLHAIDQIDVIKRMAAKYADTFRFVTSSEGIQNAFKKNKIASLVGVKGGHMIANRLSVLRAYYDLGVRYMSLTANCEVPWAASHENQESSLSVPFGEAVVMEMNRLGMIIDLSYASKKMMMDVLQMSKAPVIFVDTNSFSLSPDSRNIDDETLQSLKRNGGMVLISFNAETLVSSPEQATIKTVVDHINHIKDTIGADHVGIASGYDAHTKFPKGLEEPSMYPRLFDYLTREDVKWRANDLKRLAGKNFIRVLEEVEQVKDSLAGTTFTEEYIASKEHADACSYNKFT